MVNDLAGFVFVSSQRIKIRMTLSFLLASARVQVATYILNAFKSGLIKSERSTSFLNFKKTTSIRKVNAKSVVHSILI
jgi:hypothetical protein